MASLSAKGIAMVKRKASKRSRCKQSLHRSQEMLLQSSESTDTIDSIENDTPLKKTRGSNEQLLQQRSPESVLFESPQLELSCYDDLSPELVTRLRQMKLDPNESDKNDDKQDEVQQKTKSMELMHSDHLLKRKIDESPEKCFSMDKTLSMNDEIKVEMNECETVQENKSSKEIYICDTDLRSSKSVYELPCGYVSEPAPFGTFNSESESQNQEYHCFLDDFRSTTSSCEATGQFEDENKSGKCYETWNEQNNQSTNKFMIVNEKVREDSGGSLTTNWSECKRILSNLRQLNSIKVRTGGQECIANFLSKSKKYDESRSMQTSSLSYHTPSSMTSSENSNEFINKRHLEGNDNTSDKVDDRRKYEETKITVTKIRARSTTPCSGSPPPAKRCRTTLKFDDEEETEQSQKDAATVKVADLLPVEKNTEEEQSSSCPIPKTPWRGCTPDSPTASTLDLPAVSDSGCSTRLQECERGTECPKKCTCLTSKQNRKLPPLQFTKKPIAKIVLFWVWLIKKITSVFKRCCSSLGQVVSLSSTRRQMEELSQVVIMLRSENEQMINMFLEKVTHLTEQITQVRTSSVTAIGALTIEVNGIQDISKKLAGSNETLMLELKKLQNSLENVRAKSPKVPLPPPPPMPPILIPSSSSSMIAPPAPPPPPPPPLPSLPPPPPPPPPPLPPASFSQSPAPSITPTTPSSSRNVRTPSRKCSTPLFNRPAITVEDLLKVTLKKAPQNAKENRRNTIPGPRGPVVSLDMLRSVKLKSARRRSNERIVRSPRSARMMKTRTSSLSLSPIATGADNSLGRILKQVDLYRRGPRRLLSNTSSFNNITKDNHSLSATAEDNGS